MLTVSKDLRIAELEILVVMLVVVVVVVVVVLKLWQISLPAV